MTVQTLGVEHEKYFVVKLIKKIKKTALTLLQFFLEIFYFKNFYFVANLAEEKR